MMSLAMLLLATVAEQGPCEALKSLSIPNTTITASENVPAGPQQNVRRVQSVPHGVRCALDFFGTERMLFATDFPFDPEKGSYNIRATIADLDTLALDAKTRTAIEMGNARRLMRM